MAVYSTSKIKHTPAADPSTVPGAQQLPDEGQIKAMLPDEASIVASFNARVEEVGT